MYYFLIRKIKSFKSLTCSAQWNDSIKTFKRDKNKREYIDTIKDSGYLLSRINKNGHNYFRKMFLFFCLILSKT